MLLISARFAPLPPRRSRIVALPSWKSQTRFCVAMVLLVLLHSERRPGGQRDRRKVAMWVNVVRALPARFGQTRRRRAAGRIASGGGAAQKSAVYPADRRIVPHRKGAGQMAW